jgi:hypothetical protein
MPLEFGSDKHMLRFKDPSLDFEINATLVAEGGGRGWMRYPFPDYGHMNCDYNATAVEPDGHCPTNESYMNPVNSSYHDRHCPKCSAPWYANDDACVTVCSKHFPGTPSNAGADPKIFPWPVGRHGFHDFAVEDTVKVPANIPPGDYVLGWRWDCEMSSQVWSNCADITIVDSDEILV